jgi:hypothetical protein
MSERPTHFGIAMDLFSTVLGDLVRYKKYFLKHVGMAKI